MTHEILLKGYNKPKEPYYVLFMKRVDEPDMLLNILGVLLG